MLTDVLLAHQWLTLTGLAWLGRSCDTKDWLSNTIGTATGACLAAAALVVVRARASGAASGGRSQR